LHIPELSPQIAGFGMPAQRCNPNRNRSSNWAYVKLWCLWCSINNEFLDHDNRCEMLFSLFPRSMVCPKTHMLSLLLLWLVSVAVGVPPYVCRSLTVVRAHVYMMDLRLIQVHRWLGGGRSQPTVLKPVISLYPLRNKLIHFHQTL